MALLEQAEPRKKQIARLNFNDFIFHEPCMKTSNWSNAKKLKYQQEARTILNELKNGNDFLARRLEAKIEEYGNYLIVV